MMTDGQDHGVDSQHTDKPEAPKERRRHFEEHVKRWRSSGLTQAEYYRRNELKCSTFHYWRRRLGATSQAVTLVKVPVGFNGSGSGTWGQGLTLVLGGRYKVEIGDNFNASTLARLVDTLGQLSW
jgi:hypothetical protein